MWTMAASELSKPTTTVNRCSTRSEATRSTLTFKTAAEREGYVLNALCQHRVAMSHLSSQGEVPLSQRNWESFSENSRTTQVRCGHSVKISSFTNSKFYLLPQCTSTNPEGLPHSSNCVCCPVYWSVVDDVAVVVVCNTIKLL